mmetsp:Transcript_20026/g.51104  ORF Transcript_20026/g.51104 Transcript_20026/m.51104 type:complete len:148 (+) Transcript_20026:545-988(+)
MFVRYVYISTLCLASCCTSCWSWLLFFPPSHNFFGLSPTPSLPPQIDSSLRQTAMSEGTEKEGSEKIDHAIIAALMMQYRIEVDAEEKLAAEEQSMAERWEEHKLSETRRMEEEKQRQEEQKLSRTKKRDEIARKMKAQKKKETTKS